jgi:DnaJ like chaperone protein
MAWWGKVLGGGVGYMILGPIGALFGVALGHAFDHAQSKNWRANERIQTAFFGALFSCMGHVAKADGRVSPQEIQAVRAIMHQMRLNNEQVKVAIKLFTQGKDDDFDVKGVLAQFKQASRHRTNLLRMFMQLQLQAAYAEGTLKRPAERLLISVAAQLGFSAESFARMHQSFQAQMSFSKWRAEGGRFQDFNEYARQGGAGQRAGVQSGPDMNTAYSVLGVDKAASKEEIKRAYRRLMNQYHPDKLVAKGLPEEMMQSAKEKTQAIKEAYDAIKKHKGF